MNILSLRPYFRLTLLQNNSVTQSDSENVEMNTVGKLMWILAVVHQNEQHWICLTRATILIFY
jgi:hypothetical protein